MRDDRNALRMITSMLVSSILAIVIGIWIDDCLQTTPWMMFVLLAYAIGGNWYILTKGMRDNDI